MAHQCSVCNLPSDVRNYGEKLITEGREYREVVALAPAGPSKSSWHRHMTGCYRKRRFYGIGKRATKEERLIIELDGHFSLNGEKFDGKFRETDVVLKVVYMEADIRKLGNPSALCTPALIAEAEQEHRERFPSATIATEEVSEENNSGNTRIDSDATPCEEPKPGFDLPNASKPPAPEPTPTPCEHQWVQIVANTERCSACGAQRETSFQPRGFSRAEYEQWRGNRGALRGLGRFG